MTRWIIGLPYMGELSSGHSKNNDISDPDFLPFISFYHNITAPVNSVLHTFRLNPEKSSVKNEGRTALLSPEREKHRRKKYQRKKQAEYNL